MHAPYSGRNNKNRRWAYLQKKTEEDELRACIITGGKRAGNWRGRGERRRRATRSAPAQAGGEALRALLLVELAGPATIAASLPAGGRRTYKTCSYYILGPADQGSYWPTFLKIKCYVLLYKKGSTSRGCVEHNFHGVLVEKHMRRVRQDPMDFLSCLWCQIIFVLQLLLAFIFELLLYCQAQVTIIP